MITQAAPAGAKAAVIEQREHARLSGQLAAAWGNATFAPLAPRDLLEFLVVHHDEGWDVVDARVGRDPETGLPWNLTRTPLQEVLKTAGRGADLNERFHPYCGLLSSMHIYGLYHGRYGLSDKVFVNMIPAELRPAVDDVLAREIGRQERLKAKLAASPETAPWVEGAALFHNYKLLQFFDTLSLYFVCTHEAARGRSVFLNVPKAVGDDVEVTVERLSSGVYRVSPYPFADDGLLVSWAFRRMAPQPEGTDMAGLLASIPQEVEAVRLVS